jgi:hypothetical protein
MYDDSGPAWFDAVDAVRYPDAEVIAAAMTSITETIAIEYNG